MDNLGDEISGVVAELEAAGLHTTAAHGEAFRTYLQQIREWSTRTNLVSARDLPRLGQRHLLESFNVLHRPLPLAGARLVDVGSGAGFPGLPLAIWQPDLHLLLVESIRKKARFLAAVVKDLRLEDRVEVVWGRAEDVGATKIHRHSYDLATARGLGPLRNSVEWVAPFLRPGGHFLAFKGSQVEAEIVEAMSPMERAGLRLIDVFPLRWGVGNIVLLRREEG